MNEITVKEELQKKFPGIEIPSDALIEFESAITKFFNEVIDKMARIFIPKLVEFVKAVNEFIYDYYGYINPRVLYLSKHAKKKRVRKKNAHRLMRMAREGG